MQKTYYQLAARISEVNKANGFLPVTWDTLPTKLFFILSEKCEAWEEYGKGDKKEFGYELADIAIRLLDVMRGLWGEKWCLRECVAILDRVRRLSSLADNLMSLECCIIQAGECWRFDKKTDTMVWLEKALYMVRHIAEIYEVDLLWCVKKKIVKNAGRGKLHGKVRNDG